ncbi:DUF2239 family protein [Ferrovibrio sp.]|uniref:DUF2239 family protein n=1 Tax=Ferrovibrio sp. TaxID=1917215 RepID=UPI001B669422|nr:DUF2239 family protein [Ferrovibrio sp.]MBP7062948.1 DUF2239 family protein [Ferrovibrio sp.]
MTTEPTPTCTAFVGNRRLAGGDHESVALALWAELQRDPTMQPLVFDDQTSAPLEFDLRGSEAEMLARLRAAAAAETAPVARPGPGRPKLGVVAREVTLLPRHWDWLNAQPGGASVALRKLVEEARRATEGAEKLRRGRDAAYRFMAAMAGNAPDYDEAARALFAGDAAGFARRIEAWPADIRAHLQKLAQAAFAVESKP